MELTHALKNCSFVSDAKYSVTDHKVPVDGGEIVVRVVIPESDDPKQTFPVLTWLHGGGWALGNIDQDDWALRVWSTELQVVTVNVEFRSAPEHTFPIPWDDSYTALKWVASNAASISVSLDKGFLIGGMSAGGNLAATVAHLARDDPFFSDKPLTGSYLAIPVIVHADAYPEKFKDQLLSMEQNKDAPNLTRDSMRFYLDTVKAPPEDPKTSPLLYPSHAGLPPAYFQICGLDPLRDEGLLYERELRAAGTRTKLDVYPGVPHAFQVFSPTISAAAKYEADTLVGLKWLLAGAKY
ncbi:alpha/beta-hydrolase [Auriscalpium vulgare]|uniref:Alpha/beta-hydrolase n=1 Tax=Auriscalpium vulgare TaxID=40419 RepID=A0ACB8SAT2_9AGAM|nr:alpha/beta-hydrolase [Auriscalpium vulgare]